MAANFTPLLNQTKSDFQRWGNLPLTLPGRINSVKMTILPRFLYLFQSIPIFLPKSGGGGGGVALPNFMCYYWSANIQKLSFWFHTVNTSWGSIESKSCLGTSLSALLCSPLPTVVSKHTKNPIVLASLKIWFQFRRHFKYLSSSILAPIVGNHLFPPALDA